MSTDFSCLTAVTHVRGHWMPRENMSHSYNILKNVKILGFAASDAV